MREIPVDRRFLLGAFGIIVAAWLMRAQIADALVLRGDEWLYRAHPATSLVYYRRAAWIDPGDGVAVDRFAFVAITLRNRRVLSDAIALATWYLHTYPTDSIVRMDRAMAYRSIGRTRDALNDFAIVGARARDPRALTFAGYAARQLGATARARELWRTALALQPNFPAALHGLARTGTGK